MTTIVSTTIEILGRQYPIRCQESELKSLQQAAAFLNQKMQEIKDSGKAINLERIAIIAALNITYELLKLDHENNSIMSKINQRITLLQNKLDSAVNNVLQTELVYSAE